jgi:ADP-heptose:LPS heptosyltransferase
MLSVNLQYGNHASEIREATQATKVPLLCEPNLDPMTDVDSAISQVAAMDCVITSSNTTAHLAGAQGIKTLLLVPANRSRLWYWHRVYEECLWYPSIRYAVQDRDGRWDSAIQNFLQQISCRRSA